MESKLGNFCWGCKEESRKRETGLYQKSDLMM